MLDRRTFLRGSGLAVGAALVAACLPSNEEQPRVPPGDAIVVGAGPSGLAAATRFRAAGHRVVVLEARDRTGGRTWTSEAIGPPIDLGASWIHGTTGNPLTPLARAAGIRFIGTGFDRFGTFDNDGRRITEREETPLYEHYLALEKRLTRLATSHRADASVAAGIAEIRSDPSWHAPDGVDPAMATRYLDWSASLELGEDRAADLTELSLQTMLDGESLDGPWVMLDRGYAALFGPLAEGLDIRLGETVTAISHDQDGVTVTTDGGSFHADRGVVTLPLGVLKAGVVAFDPALPTVVRGRSTASGWATS